MQDKPKPTWHEQPGSLPGALAGMRLPDGPYVLVVSGSPQRTSPELLAALAKAAVAVIAVDSGVAPCRAAGAVPDRVVGDFDSVTDEDLAWLDDTAAAAEEHPWRKDETDLALALTAARAVCDTAEGARPFAVVTSACGGRLDHELAAIGEVARAADLAPLIVEDGLLAAILDPRGRSAVSLCELGLVEHATVSLVALAPGTRASSSGLVWELDGSPLEALSGLGVSNLVADPVTARVEAVDGTLAVIVPRGGDVG